MASYWETLAGSVAQNDGSQGLASALGAMNDYVQNVKARGDTLTQGFKDFGTGMKSALDTAQNTVDSISENNDSILNNQIKAAALEQEKDNVYYGYLDANIESKHIDNAWKQKKDNYEQMRASLGVPDGSSQDMYNAANSLIGQYNYEGSGLTNSDIEFYLKNPAALQVAIEKGNLKNNEAAKEIIMKTASDSRINRYLQDGDKLYLAEQEIEQGVLTPGEWRNVADNIYNDPNYNNRPGNSAQDIYAALMTQQNGLTGQKGTFADFQQALRAQRYVNNNVNGIQNILNQAGNNNDGSGGNGTKNPNAGGNTGAGTAGTPNNAQQQPNAAATQQATDESNNSQQLSELTLSDISDNINSLSDDAFNTLFGKTSPVQMTREQVIEDFRQNGKNGAAAKRIAQMQSTYVQNIDSSNKAVIDEIAKLAHESNSDAAKIGGAPAAILSSLVIDRGIGKIAVAGTKAFGAGGVSGVVDAATQGFIALAPSLFGSGSGSSTNPSTAKQMANMPMHNPINADEYSRIEKIDSEINDIEHKQLKRPANQWVNPDGTPMTDAQKQAEINRLNKQKNDLTLEKNRLRSVVSSRQQKIDEIVNDKKLTENEKINKMENLLAEQAKAKDEFNARENLKNRRLLRDEIARLNKERDAINNDFVKKLGDVDQRVKSGAMTPDDASVAKDQITRDYANAKKDFDNRAKTHLDNFKRAHPTNLPTNTVEKSKQAFGDFRQKVQRTVNAKVTELEKARDAAMAAEKDPTKRSAIKKGFDDAISKVKNAPKAMLNTARSHPFMTGLTVMAIGVGFALDNYLDNSISNFVKDELAGFVDANFGIGKVSSAIANNTAFANGSMTQDEWEKSMIATGELTIDDRPYYWIDRGETLGEDIKLAFRDAINILTRYTPIPGIDVKSPSWETYVKSHNAVLKDISIKRGITSINESLNANSIDNPNDFTNLLETGSPTTTDATRQVKEQINQQNAAAASGNPLSVNREALTNAQAFLDGSISTNINSVAELVNTGIGGGSTGKPGEVNSIAQAVITGSMGQNRTDPNVPIFSNTGKTIQLIPKRDEKTGNASVNTGEKSMYDVYGEANSKDFLNKVNAASNGGLGIAIKDLTTTLDMSKPQNIAVVDAVVNDKDISVALGKFRQEMKAIESGKSNKDIKEVKKAFDSVLIERVAQIVADINKIVLDGGGEYPIGNRTINIPGYGNVVSTKNGGDVGSTLIAALLQQDKYRSTPSADGRLARAATAFNSGNVKQFVEDYINSSEYYSTNQGGSASRTNEYFKLQKMFREKKITTEEFLGRFINL